MTTIDIDRSLGEIVIGHPGAAPVFERLGIDYCCHGGRSLNEAALAAGLDPAAVMDEVVRADEAASADHEALAAYADLDPAELADHIERTHHAYLHAELPRLVDLTAKIAAVHGERHPELIEVAIATVELHDDMEPHMGREEMVLFPMIRALAGGTGDAPASHCGGSLEHPIARMMLEHEATGEILERLRRLTDGYEVPEDGCATYLAAYRGLEQVERDTHTHIHKENNVLFPAAMELVRR
jgi:regulator of cell morphogenesis and NO signaling